MLEFPNVSKEIRGLLSRRQELNTLVGSVFAALGIFLQNALQGSLPASLAAVEEHLFAFYAVMLMVPCMILALRMARLHGGLVLNGMLYARLLENQTFTRKGDVQRAARHNYFGVSFLQFLLADVLAGFSAGVLALSLGAGFLMAGVVSLLVVLVWLAWYFRFHRDGAAFARKKIAAEACEPVTEDDWEAHTSACLQEANHSLTALIGFVGLMIFSVFEVMSGLGQVKTNRAPDLRADLISSHGAEVYTLLMLVTCLFGVIMYLRIRVAIGQFSLDLDPTDRPFQTGKLTDSLLGYLLLGFFLAVAVHLTMVQFAPGLSPALMFGIDGAVLVAAILAEQGTLAWASRRCGPTAPTTAPPARAMPESSAEPAPGAPSPTVPEAPPSNTGSAEGAPG
jgi:hypothetical protein